MPVQRRAIVGAKYISGLSFMLLGIVLSAVIGTAMKGFGLPIPANYFTGKDLLVIFVAASLYISIYFPI